MEATFQIKRDGLRKVSVETYPELRGVFGFHSTLELLLVRKGAAKVWIQDVDTVVRENEIAVVLSHAPHQFRSMEAGVYTCLFIPTIFCPAFTEQVRNKTMAFPILRDAETISRITQAVDALATEEPNSIERLGYIHLILGTVLRQMESSSAPVAPAPALPSRLFAYINEHYKEELTVAQLAQALGYSRAYVSEAFRAAFHIGIGDYINTLRLKNAVVLMREQDKTVTECALESGFGSLRTFYRAFRAAFGCTPNEYMRGEV